ncbi:MAG: hypothetical protein NWE98_09945 [Candidatus Bathyarchaeota archaeon]|nr:hypothetical protein [Candidatus Bathyarchaeota archaeon]
MRNMPVVARKRREKKEPYPSISCLCGAEILLVPDVKLMSKAVEAHALTHKKKMQDSKRAEEEAERIRNHLIAEVLRIASEEKS